MKEWLQGLSNYESFSGLLFNIFIFIFTFLFVFTWVKLIIWFIVFSIFDKIKKYKNSKYGYDPIREKRYYKIENIIESINEFPFNIFKEKITTNIISDELKLSYKRSKSFIIWFIGFLIITSIWINWNDPFNDFMLLTKGIQVDGLITESKQESEIVEINDGRSRREEFKFVYSYKYQTQDGNIYDGKEEVKGEQPEEFYSLEEEPIEVKVTYLESNPKYSRVFEYTTNNKNLYEWFRYTILYLVIFMSIWTYPFLSKKKN